MILWDFVFVDVFFDPLEEIEMFVFFLARDTKVYLNLANVFVSTY